MTTLPNISIYIHWPFCTSKCPYCDFNSYVRLRSEIDQKVWCDALVAEIDYAARTNTARTVSTIFFGGGTPSLMAPATVGTVIDRVSAHWSVASDIEITLEANPSSVEAQTFCGFRQAGINRLSLGVQSLDDRALAVLGRRHSASEARAAIMLAARYFDRFSFDLIYARPGQMLSEWEAELTEALSLVSDHLSVYQLTIESGTVFHELAHRGKVVLPDEETSLALFELTQTLLSEKGLPAYEISNHSRPTAECRHNLNYWHYGDYLGIGPGAHGRVTVDGCKWATCGYRVPHIWLTHVQRHGHGGKPSLKLTEVEQLEELLMMGLRLTEGVSRRHAWLKTGYDILDWLDRERVAHLCADGFLQLTDTHLRVTAKGRPCLNAVLGQIIHDHSPVNQTTFVTAPCLDS